MFRSTPRIRWAAKDREQLSALGTQHALTQLSSQHADFV